MKIAQVAPLYESVPPSTYGGTERVVSYLTEELVRFGHDVTLFASGDSITKAKLFPVCEKSLRLNLQSSDSYIHHLIQIQDLMEQSKDFDIIHFHIDCLHFPTTAFLKTPNLTTLHGRLDILSLDLLYQKFSKVPVVSISASQKSQMPSANWIDTIYHGIPEDLYSLNSTPEQYLAFLGRISPEKGLDRAIEIAKRVGIKLKIAAKVDKADQNYFDSEIKHLLDHPLVEYIGEINDHEKNDFLGNALCLIFPINWPEPFGMVMIEAMACGTPVLAFKCGSVPEVIDEGLTGSIVSSIDEAVKILPSMFEWDRAVCRNIFTKRFTAARMASNYLTLYNTINSGFLEVSK